MDVAKKVGKCAGCREESQELSKHGLCDKCEYVQYERFLLRRGYRWAVLEDGFHRLVVLRVDACWRTLDGKAPSRLLTLLTPTVFVCPLAAMAEGDRILATRGFVDWAKAQGRGQP
jgi:hypothetical protein